MTYKRDIITQNMYMKTGGALLHKDTLPSLFSKRRGLDIAIKLYFGFIDILRN